MDIKRIAGMITVAAVVAAGAAFGNPQSGLDTQRVRAKLWFSRDELLVSTRPMSQSYHKLLAGEAIEASPRKGLDLRIQRVFTKMLEQAVRLHPTAQHWDWKLVLVNQPMPPFALPNGHIFLSARWVASRRLTDAEIALLLAHEMAHVIAEHLLERISALATVRPARNMRVSDVLRMVEEEWHVAREIEPLMQAQELEADRMGLGIVCSAGIARSQALSLFDKMARADGTQEPGYINSHPEPLARKQSLLGSMHARSLGCMD
jgi:predicted Zn-dependent protease